MGSVKEFKIMQTAFENRPGTAGMEFGHTYSVFDSGSTGEQIPYKGNVLACQGAATFEMLDAFGIRTHYNGLVGENGRLIKIPDLEDGSNGSNKMIVDLAMVYHPTARRFTDLLEEKAQVVKYDYSFYENNRGIINNYLIPLEIIFRNALPLGSSVFGRIERAKKEKNAEEELQKIYDSLGVKSEPKPGDMLPKSVVGYTTKLESGDRHLARKEAYEISGLTEKEFDSMEETALKVNDVITKHAEKKGFVHYDGKIEMLRNNGFVVADVAGTFDESRFGFNGEQVSKEVIRQWFKKNQPEFPKACKEWKKTGKGWQERCPVKPIKLDPQFVNLVSQMYRAGGNKYIGRDIFGDVPPLEEVMDELRAFR